MANYISMAVYVWLPGTKKVPFNIFHYPLQKCNIFIMFIENELKYTT